MGIPQWVDCNKCGNKNTVWCMSCGVKYETVPYLNYFDSENIIITNTTVNQDTEI